MFFGNALLIAGVFLFGAGTGAALKYAQYRKVLSVLSELVKNGQTHLALEEQVSRAENANDCKANANKACEREWTTTNGENLQPR